MQVTKNYFPGPWEMYGIEIHTDAQEICHPMLPADNRSFGERKREQIANARLISAAPELADALISAYTIALINRKENDESTPEGQNRIMFLELASSALVKAGVLVEKETP